MLACATVMDVEVGVLAAGCLVGSVPQAERVHRRMRASRYPLYPGCWYARERRCCFCMCFSLFRCFLNNKEVCGRTENTVNVQEEDFCTESTRTEALWYGASVPFLPS